MIFRNILVTTDFSEHAAAACKFLEAQTLNDNAKITLLNVSADWQVPATLYEYIPDPAQIENYRNEVLKASQKKLKDVADTIFNDKEVSCIAKLSMRPAGEEITDFARSNKSDLIVLASHGAGATASFLLGSVVQKVIKLAPCPVMVVPSNYAATIEKSSLPTK